MNSFFTHGDKKFLVSQNSSLYQTYIFIDEIPNNLLIRGFINEVISTYIDL
jgi:hypothetical protein